MEWHWSDRVEEADWIAARQPPGVWVCGMPTGFTACARLLHPVEEADPDTGSMGQVRWSEISDWSGVALLPTSRFWQIALPERPPADPVPGDGAPASDVLGARDGAALARLLRRHTTTPERCWFGIWEGYGWEEQVGNPPQLSDPVPAAVRSGPRVQLPGRDYLLYAGPVEAGMAFLPEERELADLWWPEDRAWCVYGDVDLTSTYVAGSAELVETLLASTDVEAVDADPEDAAVVLPGDVPEWLTERVEATVAALLAARQAELATSRFTVRFELLGRRWLGWRLAYQSDDPTSASGCTTLDGAHLANHLRREVTMTVVDLLEG